KGPDRRDRRRRLLVERHAVGERRLLRVLEREGEDPSLLRPDEERLSALTDREARDPLALELLRQVERRVALVFRMARVEERARVGRARDDGDRLLPPERQQAHR